MVSSVLVPSPAVATITITISTGLASQTQTGNLAIIVFTGAVEFGSLRSAQSRGSAVLGQSPVGLVRQVIGSRSRWEVGLSFDSGKGGGIAGEIALFKGRPPPAPP